jgi:predicted dehydrogenase
MPRPRIGRSRSRGTQPRRLAIAGAGSIAVVHALVAPAAGAKVHAVASAGGSSARHLAGQLDARRCRPEDLPAGADALVVATPPSSHLALALAGVRAGVPVLVEKPVTATLSQADELLAAAERSAAVVRVAENLLHAPAWCAAWALRESLGAPEHVSARAVQPAPDWGHFAQPLAVGGVLFDLGPHPISLVLALAASAPVGVSAQLRSTRDDGADDDATVSIRFGSGLVAQVVVSWTSDQVVWDLQSASGTGVLRVELLPEILVEHNGEPIALPGPRHQVPDPRLEQFGYVDQLADLLGDAPGGQDVHAARQVLEVICAAYASAGEGGSEVTLPFTGDRTRTPMQLWRDRARGS